ncbi:hypothetical protein [Hominenteromicrobium sp.]
MPLSCRSSSPARCSSAASGARQWLMDVCGNKVTYNTTRRYAQADL